jgi:hypothetical protein
VRPAEQGVTPWPRTVPRSFLIERLKADAVVTAQVASNFVAQGPSRAQQDPQPEPAAPEVTLAQLDRRLARIEELLTDINRLACVFACTYPP